MEKKSPHWLPPDWEKHLPDNSVLRSLFEDHRHRMEQATVRAKRRLLGFWILRVLVVAIWVGCVWGFVSSYL